MSDVKRKFIGGPHDGKTYLVPEDRQVAIQTLPGGEPVCYLLVDGEFIHVPEDAAIRLIGGPVDGMIVPDSGDGLEGFIYIDQMSGRKHLYKGEGRTMEYLGIVKDE